MNYYFYSGAAHKEGDEYLFSGVLSVNHTDAKKSFDEVIEKYKVSYEKCFIIITAFNKLS